MRGDVIDRAVEDLFAGIDSVANRTGRTRRFRHAESCRHCSGTGLNPVQWWETERHVKCRFCEGRGTR